MPPIFRQVTDPRWAALLGSFTGWQYRRNASHAASRGADGGMMMNVEQALNAADEGEKEGLSGLYPTVGQVLAAEVRELRESIASIRASAQMGCVYLQSARDGVWAHFRIGRGKAYSVCLSNDQMSMPFAIEYAKAHAEISKATGA